jgi:biotin transport system ATP-binding protein
VSIELDGVSVTIGGRRVLQGLTVRLDERRVGVVGANGSGKSTFARLLNGLVLPSEGRVRVDALDTRTDGAAVRRRVGFVFTNPDAQIVMPTVAEDVALSLRATERRPAPRAAAITAALERFGLADLADRPAARLSSGQKQLLALASVLVTEPDVLVCDEPTTMLDLVHTRRIRDVLAALPQRLVLVSHALDAFDGFDRVLVLHEGRLVADDAPGPAVAAYRTLVDRLVETVDGR